MKEEVEWAIIKENIGYFRLAYTLPLLEGDLSKDLSILGEDKLIEDLLQDQVVLQEYTKIKEAM